MRTKSLRVLSVAVAAIALPALAHQVVQNQSQPAAAPASSAPADATETATQPAADQQASPADESATEQLNTFNVSTTPTLALEYPGWARRNPWVVGSLDPESHGFGTEPWGSASGIFLSELLRRMDTPIASRWAHIALRDALLAKAKAPSQVNPVDWVAERAWLLLRLGEADAARMLVSGVDTDRFTPKMVQVGVQSALANADASALCPLESGIAKYDANVRALVEAMCSALAGEKEIASAMIDEARRHGRVGGVDLALAEKVVGAAGSGRATTIEWDPVDTLTAWRFGLAAATGMAPPDRLVSSSPTQLRAFEARAPLLSPKQRLDSALVAAGIGVFSSQSLIDLYSAIYDSTDPSDLPGTDAWQVRQAFVGKDQDTRLGAVRKLLGNQSDPVRKEAMRALVARAATLVKPDPKLAKDAPDLISAMLAAGYDQAAAQWIPAIGRMDDANSDRCWAMVALAGPGIADVGANRLNAFIGRDQSRNKMRSALLVAGLAGLGRISTATANSLNRRYGFGLGRQSSWTSMIDGSAARGQAGTVLVLTGTGFQTADISQIPAVHMYHAVAALKRTGQEFTARMIAAEALSRT